VTASNIFKTYDGQTASVAGISYSSTPNSSLRGTLGYSDSVNVGSYAPSGLYSDQQGYLVTYVDGTLTINKADLNLSGTRVYNGSSSFAGSQLSATGVNGETFAVTGTGDGSNLSSKNVQTAQNLASVTGLALGAGATGAAVASNYNALAALGSSVSVTAAPLTVSGMQATSREFNGNAVAGLTGGVLSGLVDGEVLDFSGQSGLFSDASVGSAKPVTVSGLSLLNGSGAGAGLASNYSVSQPAGLTANITAAPVSEPSDSAAVPSSAVMPVGDQKQQTSIATTPPPAVVKGGDLMRQTSSALASPPLDLTQVEAAQDAGPDLAGPLALRISAGGVKLPALRFYP
jgi:hypothetical protein